MSANGLEIDLSGNHWKMEKIRPGGGVTEGFDRLPSEYQGTGKMLNRTKWSTIVP